MVTRRIFLRGAAAMSCSAVLPPNASPASAETPVLFGAARIGGQDGGVTWCAGAAKPFSLPARGHGLARLATRGKIIITGRRPGLFAALVDTTDPAGPSKVVQSAPGCRFSGHSAVEPAGDHFVTSEFEAETVRGVLVLRRADDGSECGRFDPEGTEPHDMLFTANRLVAALGGLIKDGGVAGPAFNPDGIRSSVVEIDAQSGKIVARHVLAAELASLSLRHLARAPDGQSVVVGMQDQDLSETRPLVAVIKIGGDISPLPMPDAKLCDFRGYVGSVAVDSSGEFAAATSPRGSVMGLWSLSKRAWVGGLGIPDVCGLVAGNEPREFWASSGLGEVINVSAAPLGATVKSRWSTSIGFDNHLLRV